MTTKLTGDKRQQIEHHEAEKRREIIWSLKAQGHSNAMIGRIFNITRVRVGVIVKGIPSNYKSPWIKIRQ
jgi:DNA-binding NarL/FixJ family response regulator